MIYFDNAATTYPKPKAVMAAVQNAVTAIGANPGRGAYRTAEQAGDLIYRTREHICGFFSVYEKGENDGNNANGANTADESGGKPLPAPQRVIFTPGCTWSVNCVLKGVLRPGDNVLISDLEHNAVVRPLARLKKTGVSVTRVHIVEGDPDATLNNFRSAIRRDTKMIFCTHASNVTGAKLPAERIGMLCREHGLLFGLDCAQSAGAAELGFDTVKADFMCMPAHKGLYGIMGCGLLLLGGGTVPSPLCEGGTGSLSALREMPRELPDRLEPGTLNLPGIAALDAGLTAVERVGRKKLLSHEMGLISYIYREFSSMKNVMLYTLPPRPATHVPLLCFNAGSLPSEKTAELLASRGIAVRAGFHCAYDAHVSLGTQDRGAVRVCPSMFTSPREAEALVRAVYEIAK